MLRAATENRVLQIKCPVDWVEVEWPVRKRGVSTETALSGTFALKRGGKMVQ